tara:strand:- start:594 stop:839 length:246 start_codon:yes stop_codon:yes gene_type:complete
MPTYQYKCEKCGDEFEEIHRINEREFPLQTPCETCSGILQIVPQMPSMVSMRDGWRRHTDDGWKDRLKQIKRNNPGSTLDV